MSSLTYAICVGGVEPLNNTYTYLCLLSDWSLHILWIVFRIYIFIMWCGFCVQLACAIFKCLQWRNIEFNCSIILDILIFDSIPYCLRIEIIKCVFSRSNFIYMMSGEKINHHRHFDLCVWLTHCGVIARVCVFSLSPCVCVNGDLGLGICTRERYDVEWLCNLLRLEIQRAQEFQSAAQFRHQHTKHKDVVFALIANSECVCLYGDCAINDDRICWWKPQLIEEVFVSKHLSNLLVFHMYRLADTQLDNLYMYTALHQYMFTPGAAQQTK